MSEQPDNPDPFRFPDQRIERERDILGKQPPGDLIDWSHRKGEPRVFALLWMIFLLMVTAMMFSRLATAYSISPSISRPASRQMLVVIAFGMCVLWPMTRLSQTIPRPSIVASCLRDMVVILIPLQAIVWPQRLIVLGGWSTKVVLVLDLHFLAWGLVIAGATSIASILIAGSTNHARARVLAMLAVLMVVFGVPMVELVTLKGAPIGPANANLGWMLSPITGILEITADRSALGQPAIVYNAHFRMIVGVGCVGLALLIFGRALENARWVARRGMKS